MNRKYVMAFTIIFSLFFFSFLTISCDSTGCGTEMQLDVTAADVEVFTTSELDVLAFHIPDQQFFLFADQKVVLSMCFYDPSSPLYPDEAIFNVFDEDESLEGIRRWINNQHSDTVMPDPAVPTSKNPLPADHFTIISKTLVEQKTSRFGVLIGHMIVEYNVAPYTIDGLLTLEGLAMKRTFTTPRMKSFNLNREGRGDLCMANSISAWANIFVVQTI